MVQDDLEYYENILTFIRYYIIYVLCLLREFNGTSTQATWVKQ